MSGSWRYSSTELFLGKGKSEPDHQKNLQPKVAGFKEDIFITFTFSNHNNVSVIAVGL